MNIWAGIALGAIALVAYGFTKLSHAGAQLVTQSTGRVHSIDITKIVFAIDTILKNPTGTALVIQYPFIKISYKGNLIASSDLVDKQLTIAALTQTSLTGIKIPVNFFSLSSVGAELIKKIQDKTVKVTMQVTVQTIIYAGGAKIPYTTTEDISI